MKKMTLLAAMAVCGVGAMNAQYMASDPGIAATNGDVYYVFNLDATTVGNLEAQLLLATWKLQVKRFTIIHWIM